MRRIYATNGSIAAGSVVVIVVIVVVVVVVIVVVEMSTVAATSARQIATSVDERRINATDVSIAAVSVVFIAFDIVVGEMHSVVLAWLPDL